jgi:hypothetical protein
MDKRSAVISKTDFIIYGLRGYPFQRGDRRKWIGEIQGLVPCLL